MSVAVAGFVQSTGGNGIEGGISRVFATAAAVARAGQLVYLLFLLIIVVAINATSRYELAARTPPSEQLQSKPSSTRGSLRMVGSTR